MLIDIRLLRWKIACFACDISSAHSVWSQCFQEIPHLVILSLPSHLVPIDKHSIIYMDSDYLTHPQCPTHPKHLFQGVMPRLRHPGQKQVNGILSVISKCTHSVWGKGVEERPAWEFLTSMEEWCLKRFPQWYGAFLQGFVEWCALLALFLKWENRIVFCLQISWDWTQLTGTRGSYNSRGGGMGQTSSRLFLRS